MLSKGLGSGHYSRLFMTELLWHFTVLCIDMVFLEHPADLTFMQWNWSFFLAFPISFMTWIIPSHPSTKAGSWFQFLFTPYESSPHFPALPQEAFWPGYGDVSGLCDYSSLLFQQTVTPNNVRFSSVLGYQQPATPIGKNTHRHFLWQDGN